MNYPIETEFYWT